MTDSFEQRIAAAQHEHDKAVTSRDKLYPGSVEWERANATVTQWQRTILDLREQAGA